MEPMILTDNQQRHFRSSLLLYEKALRLVDDYLARENEAGILFHQNQKLDQRSRLAARVKISQALQELAVFVNQLGLEPEEENLKWAVMAQLNSSWVVLENCLSGRMSGYGKLDAATAVMTDAAISQLARKTLDIIHLMDNSPD